MNILVVSENFSMGGLETNINTLHNVLKKRNKMIYAFGSYKKTSYLNDAKIYKGFHFRYDVNVLDFCSDVERLVKIIKEEKIDVVHVHPFYSVYQAFFAAQLTNTKLVYTSHGYASLAFTPSLFDEILFEYIFEKGISLNISVSEKLFEMSRRQGNDNYKLIPNPINLKAYKKTKIQNNKKWALVSRLDIDKYGSIAKLLEMLPKLNICSVDIYGDGSESKKLQSLAKKKKLNVNFMGYVDNINEVTLDKYNGIIGLGRVAIEGLAMGYPVLFIGYDKICGLIDKDIYERAKKLNFVPELFNDISVDELNKQLKDLYANNTNYCFRNQVKKEFDVKTISEQYINAINENPAINNQEKTNELFKKIKSINSNQLFHMSETVAETVYKHIRFDTRNVFIKNKLFLHEEIERNKVEFAKIREEINDLKKYTDDIIDKKVDFILSNINSSLIIKNDFNRVFNRRNDDKN